MILVRAVRTQKHVLHVSKSTLNIFNSLDSLFHVGSKNLAQSARADCAFRPSGIVAFPQFQFSLTRIFVVTLPKVSNLILKAHNFQLPTKRRPPLSQTHYRTKRHPETHNFNCSRGNFPNSESRFSRV